MLATGNRVPGRVIFAIVLRIFCSNVRFNWYRICFIISMQVWSSTDVGNVVYDTWTIKHIHSHKQCRLISKDSSDPIVLKISVPCGPRTYLQKERSSLHQKYDTLQL